ncbi:RNA directed DNA polymerase from mobile element jockey like [Plakobranchus ocellatus]|uniref:RNA directed DNA polymerase from mobile element jockey like n=1 Tax=Plakobranchus ocellatus TaxID=259542 RepID=A0AAV3Z1H1_9GAST|nr:RNA directed DNA polymerase from mobile element jockey like [Plakobranchus ocellatus]
MDILIPKIEIFIAREAAPHVKLFYNIWTTGDICPSWRGASVVLIPKHGKVASDATDLLHSQAAFSKLDNGKERHSESPGPYTSSGLSYCPQGFQSELDYSSVVYIYGSATKQDRKALEPTNHQGLHIVLRAFRTSPIKSLYSEAGVTSLAWAYQASF